MADWDEEGFEPGEITEKKGDAWEGEDEDDNELKENWDDEDEEKDKPVETESSTVESIAVVKKKKSTVKQKILEKEEKRKEELLRKAEMEEQEDDEDHEDDDEESIFASKLESKLENQKLQEESDLKVAEDLFGGVNIDETTKSIDTFKPTNKDEFNELAKMLADKLSQFETSVEYPGFLEVLLRDLASGMEADDVKKLASVLNILASEKQKAQKGGKAKKKIKKAVLGGGAKGTKGVDIQDYGDVYDDFM